MENTINGKDLSDLSAVLEEEAGCSDDEEGAGSTGGLKPDLFKPDGTMKKQQ